MNHPVLMRFLQRLRHLERDGGRVFHGQAPLLIFAASDWPSTNSITM